MLNLRWSWNAGTAGLFASIDPDAWEASGGDPVAMFSAMGPDRLAALAADDGFCARLSACSDDLRDYLTGPHWYQQARELAGPAAREGEAGETGGGRPGGIAPRTAAP